MVIHQAIGNDENFGLGSIMDKLFNEETSIFVVKEDNGAVVSALGNMMKKFGHYNPGSSWHTGIFGKKDGKLSGQVMSGT